MLKEKVTIWSNSKLHMFDDLPAIKNELTKNGREVEIVSCKLLKDLENIRVYKVSYEFVDSAKSKAKVK